jgi:[ribosomal protein S5]-alanine N-acetyltransferase
MIRGDRIVLRAVGAADLPALYRLLGDVSLQGDHPALPPRSEPSFRKEFAETGFLGRRRGRLLVTDLDDRMLGTIVYFGVDTMDALELGYHLFDPAARGQGLMSEALRLAVRYLFANHEIDRLQIATAADNEASKRLALKCGFRLEGRLRGRLLHHGRDSVLYSLLRREAIPRHGIERVARAGPAHRAERPYAGTMSASVSSSNRARCQKPRSAGAGSSSNCASSGRAGVAAGSHKST